MGENDAHLPSLPPLLQSYLRTQTGMSRPKQISLYGRRRLCTCPRSPKPSSSRSTPSMTLQQDRYPWRNTDRIPFSSSRSTVPPTLDDGATRSRPRAPPPSLPPSLAHRRSPSLRPRYSRSLLRTLASSRVHPSLEYISGASERRGRLQGWSQNSGCFENAPSLPSFVRSGSSCCSHRTEKAVL